MLKLGRKVISLLLLVWEPRPATAVLPFNDPLCHAAGGTEGVSINPRRVAVVIRRATRDIDR